MTEAHRPERAGEDSSAPEAPGGAAVTQAKLLMAAEAAGIGLWTWDPVADVITWEDTTCALYGRAPGDVPKTRDEYLSLIHPEDRDTSRRRITRGQEEGHWEHEYRIRRPDGQQRWLASRTRIVRTDRGDLVVGAVFDVTERREMEERSRMAQRLEVVGQLTAGIAHNFNNLLMGILPTLELASRTAPPELRSLLRIAEESAQRAAGVVRQLMTYASQDHGRVQRPEPIAPLVEYVTEFCRSTLDPRIALEVDCKDPGIAEVDASQLEQAVINILINARDALEDEGIAAPTIRVAVTGVEPGALELGGRAGEWVRIRIADNGPGMDEATLARAFEPFFTTKPVDRGTGLGLATTHAILRDHGGFVTCESTPGLGSTFTLYLPRSRRTVPTDVAAEEPSSGPTADPAQRAVVLVVDDDERVRTVIQSVLEADGFTVETAPSGDAAIALLSEPSRAAGVDVVLLDVSMPGTSGPETRRQLASIVPELPVVFLTGYAHRPPQTSDPVLAKPVTRAKLVGCLREVLDGRKPPSPL